MVVEERPVSSSVCALENDSVEPYGIERRSVLRVDHKRAGGAKTLRQPVVNRVPTSPAIRALDETSLLCQVQRARITWVNRDCGPGR